VHADIAVTDAELSQIRINTKGGGRYLPQFTINIEDDKGEAVARVQKTLYIKRKTG